MAIDDTRVKKGNISTYENASDEYLKQRLEQIRVEIREPHLSVAEFFQGVASQVGFTALATGWTAWQGLDKALNWLVAKHDWAASRMTVDGGKIGFMKDEKSYEETLVKVSKKISDFIAGGGESQMNADKLLQALIDEPKALGHTGAVERLTELQKEFKTLAEEAKGTRLLDVLKEINTANRQGHAGQYARIWDRIDKLKAESPGLSPSRLAEEAFMDLKGDIIGRGLEDNHRIINKYRIPATAVLVTGAALFAGYRSQHSSLKQKVLDLESEASYIERLQRERRHKASEEKSEPKESAPDVKKDEATPDTKVTLQKEQAKTPDTHAEKLEAKRESRELEPAAALG